MSEEKKIVEFKDEELEKVSGGGRHPPVSIITCPRGYSGICSTCNGCQFLTSGDGGFMCRITGRNDY